MTPLVSDNSIAIGITIVTFAVLYIFVFILQRERGERLSDALGRFAFGAILAAGNGIACRRPKR